MRVYEHFNRHGVCHARRDDTRTGQIKPSWPRPFKASAMYSRRTCGISRDSEPAIKRIERAELLG